MRLTCASCGETFEGRKDGKFCSAKCRNRGRRSGASTTSPSKRQVTSAGKDFESAVRRELRQLGATDTTRGRQALLLAARMADPAESGSNVAALGRSLEELLAEIRKGTAASTDPVERAKVQARASTGALRVMQGGA